jgi:hypothetical protein
MVSINLRIWFDGVETGTQAKRLNLRKASKYADFR